MIEYVKVPEGSVRRAVSLGLKSELLSYLKLKTINYQGYFNNGSDIREISNKLRISTRTVNRWFVRLLEAGWMYKENNKYGLISYDRVWESLGYDLSINRKLGRKGMFKIYKIQANDINLLSIVKEEIKSNQSRQAYVIKRKLTQNLADTKVDEVRGISLSCSSVGGLLGYRKSSGFSLEKGLKRRYPNSVYIDNCVEYIGEKQNGHNRGFYIERGILFKVAPNRIIIH